MSIMSLEEASKKEVQQQNGNFNLRSICIMLRSYQQEKITDPIISFTGSHPFHDWTGISTKLKLDMNCPENNESCDYSFTIPWTSFDSGNDNRDNNMLYYVNAYEFHNIKMTFKDVKLDSIQQYNSEAHILEGTLSIAGVNKQIYIPINFEFTESHYELQSEFSLKVSDFNIEEASCF